MDRKVYNKCMGDYIRGKGKTPEERRIGFCVGAKMCSGKAAEESEARELCLVARSEPKPPKVRKNAKKDTCDLNIFQELMSQYENVYINTASEQCAPCQDLDTKIREADIPFQVVVVPEICTEILDFLEVDSFPTVLKLTKGKVESRHVGSNEDTIEKMTKGL